MVFIMFTVKFAYTVPDYMSTPDNGDTVHDQQSFDTLVAAQQFRQTLSDTGSYDDFPVISESVSLA